MTLALEKGEVVELQSERAAQLTKPLCRAPLLRKCCAALRRTLAEEKPAAAWSPLQSSTADPLSSRSSFLDGSFSLAVLSFKTSAPFFRIIMSEFANSHEGKQILKLVGQIFIDFLCIDFCRNFAKFHLFGC